MKTYIFLNKKGIANIGLDSELYWNENVLKYDSIFSAFSLISNSFLKKMLISRKKTTSLNDAVQNVNYFYHLQKYLSLLNCGNRLHLNGVINFETIFLFILEKYSYRPVAINWTLMGTPTSIFSGTLIIIESFPVSGE